MQTRTLDQSVAVPKREIIHIRANADKEPPKLRVAGYARVSSDSSDQLNSFTTQINHYTKIIEEKQNWQLVDIYADEGISGTSTEKRDDFNRMLIDCRKGKIDRIITKSLSRFSRNTVDSIRVTRELKQLGISICFEKDGIDTAVLTSENLLTLYALFAQQESQSISQNCKKGARMRMSKGEYVASNAAYGYRLVGNELHVYEPEATVVRRIFAEYLSGKGTHLIASELNQAGISPKSKSGRWKTDVILELLKNERYVGDSLFQKTFSENDLPYTKHRNKGELPQYYVKNTHAPIIDRTQFELTQILLCERKPLAVQPSKNRMLAGKIRCKCCDSAYRHKHSNGKEYWVCRTHDNNKDSCHAQRMSETAVYIAFERMYQKLQEHCGEILVPMVSQLEAISMQEQKSNVALSTFNRQIAELTEQSHNLSSGTPAMKSALYVLATTRPIKILAIQVATPAQKENVKTELPENYDINASLELNEDNQADFVNRCLASQNENLLVQFTKQSIIKLINAFDYTAALVLAEQIEGFFTKDAIAYLRAAKARINLDLAGYTKALKETKADFMPIKSGDKRKIFEYVLMLTVREKQGNYADFIRGLTPIFLHIFENCLLSQCGINIKDYCIQTKQYGETIYKLSIAKLQETEKGKEICEVLQKRRFVDETVYSTAHIFPIIEHFSNNQELVEALGKLEEVRKKRNVVAHEIVCVNDAWIKNRTGLNTKEITKTLKYCISKTGINIAPSFWESYEDMNAVLVEELLKDSF